MLLRLATPSQPPRDLPPVANPYARAPSPNPSCSPGTPRGCSTVLVLGWLRIPSLWEAGSRNQEVTEKQEAGGQGGGAGLTGAGPRSRVEGAGLEAGQEPDGQEHEERGSEDCRGTGAGPGRAPPLRTMGPSRAEGQGPG